MDDLIRRKNAIKDVESLPNCKNGFSDTYDKACYIRLLEEVPAVSTCEFWDSESNNCALYRPSAQPEQRWIPTSEKLPDELAEVNVTWENTEPEPYYDFVKGHCFTGTAVYFRGKWYWYSAVCVDYLREYGFSPNDEMDHGIKVLAWMPLPKPYKEGEDA